MPRSTQCWIIGRQRHSSHSGANSQQNAEEQATVRLTLLAALSATRLRRRLAAKAPTRVPAICKERLWGRPISCMCVNHSASSGTATAYGSGVLWQRQRVAGRCLGQLLAKSRNSIFSSAWRCGDLRRYAVDHHGTRHGCHCNRETECPGLA